MINIKDFKSSTERRQALEKELNTELKNIAQTILTDELVQNRNIENLLGAVQIPVGIAGPLKISGHFAKGDFYLPLATTEGALVASVSRGAKAISLSDGVNVYSENIGTTRGPVFETADLNESFGLKKWILNNLKQLDQVARETSSHLSLIKAESEVLGKNVYVRFYFDTKDAMGMNMVTIATASLNRLIEAETRAKCVSLAGNFDTDKKPSWLNFLKGRGKKVWAEAEISQKVINEVLKTTPEKIDQVVRRKCHLGSIMSGSMGFNSHFANIVAAIFCATGQDLAHTTEGSLGVTTTDIVDGALYLSVYLPDLMIGTVGGGTGLPSQKEALSILGIPDRKLKTGEQVLKLAEIIGSTVLAGELSLLAALASGDLARAHERLGRGRK